MFPKKIIPCIIIKCTDIIQRCHLRKNKIIDNYVFFL